MRKLTGMKLACVLALGALLAAGCALSEPADTEATNPTISQLYKEKPLGIQQVVDQLQAYGVRMSRSKQVNYYMLNKIHPIEFELPGKERLFLYLYDSPKGPRLAREDFADQTKLKDLKLPLFYDVKNMLIVYEHNAQGEHPEETAAYRQGIEQTIGVLLGDEVVLKGGAEYNTKKLQLFADHVKTGLADQLKITLYTIEGDPVYKYAGWDGSRLLVLTDDSQDRYAGSGKGIVQTNCETFVKERVVSQGEAQDLYTAKGCSGDHSDLRLATVRIHP